MRTRSLALLVLACPSLSSAVVDVSIPSLGDCNQNGILDGKDVTTGLSSDADGDGIPDECCVSECAGADCNRNLVEDVFDIALGTSLDCNCNLIPDECEETVACQPPGSNGRRGGGTFETEAGHPVGPPGYELPVCGQGGTGVAADDLVLTFRGIPPGSDVWIIAGNRTLDLESGVTVMKSGLSFEGAVELCKAAVDAQGRVQFERPAKNLPPGFLAPGDRLSFQCLFVTKGGEGISREYLVTFTP